MGENLGDGKQRVRPTAEEAWLTQGLHDGRLWADAADPGQLRDAALNEQRQLPPTSHSLAVEYRRRFSDFDSILYLRAWEAAIGLVWLRRRGEDSQARA